MVLNVSREDILARIAASHEDVRAVYGYWLARLDGRAMPRRADIDPAALKAFLPRIVLVDVTADERRFVYRLVGTAEVEMRGDDPTGKPVGEAGFGGPEDEALRFYEYEQVVRQRAPFCYRGSYAAPDGETETEDVIYLPLSEDGESVTMILVFSHNYSGRRRASGSAM